MAFAHVQVLTTDNESVIAIGNSTSNLVQRYLGEGENKVFNHTYSTTLKIDLSPQGYRLA